jgi:hypothetical protein
MIRETKDIHTQPVILPMQLLSMYTTEPDMCHAILAACYGLEKTSDFCCFQVMNALILPILNLKLFSGNDRLIIGDLIDHFFGIALMLARCYYCGFSASNSSCYLNF